VSSETSHAITASAGVVGQWLVPVQAMQARVTNRSANEVWISTDGSTPVVAADGLYYLPAVVGAQIVIALNPSPGAEQQKLTNVQAVSSAALSIEVEV
jgi:hypothetical protein